ncbi:PopZ family protein [Rhizobium sp.]|uniref:PopZ family protein n=1 Tax=Rhizobium sp. TaxID=391 RepID=UPI00289B6574
MAQPNVAREPSMEEILASIRRIIESNDPGSDAAGLHEASSTFEDDEIEDFDGSSAFVPDVVANDVGLPRQPEFSVQQETFAAPAAAERSLSLADVAARVRAASARHQDIPMSRSGNVSEVGIPLMRDTAPVAIEAPSQTVFSEPSAPVIPLPLPELRPSFDDSAIKSPVAPASVEAVQLPAISAPEAIKSDHIKPEPFVPTEVRPQVVQSGASIATMAGLLSETAGAQVAKSFGELAEVFDGLERRSVEDMAQEMLRPMLQEWLDDNLPTLVERLVREEIERVARGPRR